MAANENFWHWFDCHKKIMQKYRKLSPDSVDTLNSYIGQNLMKLWGILNSYKFFFKCLSLSQYSTCWHFKKQYSYQSWEHYGLINLFYIFWFEGALILKYLCVKNLCTVRSWFEALEVLGSKIEENRPPLKKMGGCLI